MFDGIEPSLRLLFINADTWPAFADRVQPHLAEMADGSGDRFLASDIQSAITSGHMHLWLVLDGANIACALVTELVHYPRLRALRMVGIVGHNARLWVHLLASIEEAAKTNFGCQKMEALHTPGHARMLVTRGWSTFHHLSEKTL